MRGPWRAEARALIALSLPLAGSQLAHIAMSTTSVIMLGRLGPDALAAGGLGLRVYFVPFMFCVGVMSAVAALVAQAVGRQDETAIRLILHQGLRVGVATGLVMAIGLWQIEPLLHGLGQNPEIVAAAVPFIRIIAIGIVPWLWFLALRGLVAALGRPRAVMLVMIAGCLAHIGLSYALIFGRLGIPAQGMNGAALSLTIIYSLMFVVLLAYVRLSSRFRHLRIGDGLLTAEWRRFHEILRVGTPVGATVVLEIGLFTAAVMLMGRIGTAEIAAHQIAQQCAATAFMVPLGIAQATTIRVGYAAGRGDAVGVRLAGWTGLVLGAAFMCLPALLFAVVPREIAGLFIDAASPANQRVSELAVAFLAVAAIFQIVDGVQTVIGGALRGLKDTRVPLLFAAIGYWGLGFTASVVFGFLFGLGGVGIWMGLAVGLAVVAVMLIARFERLSTRVTRAALQ